MAGSLYGFIVDAEMTYFACFRKPTSTSLMLTYPVPPFTTIIGMIANALGVSRPVYFEGIAKLQELLCLNLRPIYIPQRPSRETARILKLLADDLEQALTNLVEAFRAGASETLLKELIERAIQASKRPRRPYFTHALTQVSESLGKSLSLQHAAEICERLWQEFRKTSRSKPVEFPSSPMHKYFLVRPAFRFFVASEDNEAISEIVNALRQPERPLYLGQSDDMVVVEIVWQGEVLPTESDQAWAMLVGARASNEQSVELLRLPLAFASERQLLYSPLLSLPTRFPFQLPNPEPMWRFGDETVPLICIREAMKNAVAGETGGN
ncbi:CRISPR-associated protein Cas5 [Fervidibacter sacchari]|uniref:CRISPR-associated protein Cas5h n=1 Tax=Candidatus Fervidibacter sacchari TaxID=1448929 RepID=A0ABT2ERW5_9BACT|nr:CRISPR-associated protein Cas5 [Candidatus Fervidibacter sacchari]MCS3920676.1 CRISPR-associated protein Cas5h [Candidatus Fervidibacter sacchari]WKU16350.1 CRISPR-associated protein Cas5 [Candidatus Fervidibacter sacchari]